MVALLGWITASQTFIVLNGNRLVHPSSLAWPLYLCIAGIVIGGYAFLAADHGRIPIPGREYEKPDHGLRYALWFQEPVIEWISFEDEPDKLYAQVGIWISNGASGAPIVAEVEHMDVAINGIQPNTSPDYLPLRLLPTQRKRYLSNRIDDIPHGNIYAEIYYSLKFGPVSGFPVYRRTHKIRVIPRMPITPALIRSGNTPGLTWIELEPEVDIDLCPTTRESDESSVKGKSNKSKDPIRSWAGTLGPANPARQP